METATPKSWVQARGEIRMELSRGEERKHQRCWKKRERAHNYRGWHWGGAWAGGHVRLTSRQRRQVQFRCHLRTWPHSAGLFPPEQDLLQRSVRVPRWQMCSPNSKFANRPGIDVLRKTLKPWSAFGKFFLLFIWRTAVA